jgi:DUF4097 and DUF4098 domain-containing protein YvlB
VKNIILTLIMIQSSLSFAGVVEVPLEGLQRLVLKGWDAQVTFTGTPSKNLRISGVDDVLTPGLYIVEKKGGVLEVHMNEWTSKVDWKEQALKKQRKVLEISGGALPIDVYLKEGVVQLTRWSKEARVTMAQGKVASADAQGPLDINLHNGDINIQQHSGKLKVEQYQGNITIRQFQGDLDLVAFGSPVLIEKSKGLMNLNTQNSPTRVVQSSGTLQLENGRGVINIQQFQGRLEGSTQEGSITATVQADSEVHLRSQSGRVQLQLPPASGAALNLLSQEGDIYVPNGKVNRSATERSFRGRLSGDTQKVSVTVRTQEAPIVIK